PLIEPAAPAAHSASRRDSPKQPKAPAVASASSAGTESAVRRAKSSRSAYGWAATIAAAASLPRLRTSDRPTRIAGWGATGLPPDGTGSFTAAGGQEPLKLVVLSLGPAELSSTARTPLALMSTPLTCTLCLRTSLIRLAGE